MIALKRNGNDIAIPSKRVGQFDVEPLKITGSNFWKDEIACHSDRVRSNVVIYSSGNRTHSSITLEYCK